MEPQESGDEGAPDEKSGDEGEKYTQEKFISSDRNAGTKSKAFKVSIRALLGVGAVAGIGFWEIAENLHGFWCAFFHWMSLSSVACAVIAIAEKSVKNKFWIVLISIVSCTVLAPISFIVWPFPLPWIKTTNSPSFRVISGWASNTPQGGMWYVANGSAAQYHCNALVSFTNLLPVPIMVESYLVEEKTSADKWERDDLENVWMSANDGGGAFFFGNVNGDRKDMREVKFTTLDEAFANKEIGSNETVRGWIFLKRLWWTNPLRLTIEDSTGHTYSELLQSGARPNPIQPMMMETVRRHVDISTVPESH